MKRDFELIRIILEKAEAFERVDNRYTLEIEGYSSRAVSYHVSLLSDAGLVVSYQDASEFWYPTRLTWAGHEFLDAIRHKNAWQDVRRVMEKTGGFVYEVAKPLLIEAIKREALKHLS